MTLAIYHVTCSADSERATIGVCADGKTEAARIVRARVLSDGYQTFVHYGTKRVAGPGQWEPGTTIWY